MKMLERQRIREEKIKIKVEQIRLKQIETEKVREDKEKQRQEQLKLKEIENEWVGNNFQISNERIENIIKN